MKRCVHVRINGTQCRALAVHQEQFCFFHRESNKEYDALRPSCLHLTTPPQIDLPAIDDLSSVQLALSRILNAVATNNLDNKRAGLLLYGLQIAKSTVLAANKIPDLDQTVTKVQFKGDRCGISQEIDPKADIDPDDPVFILKRFDQIFGLNSVIPGWTGKVSDSIEDDHAAGIAGTHNQPAAAR